MSLMNNPISYQRLNYLLQISKFGGLTRAKQAVELCSSLGIAMTIEDSWGGDITTAAILHLAHRYDNPMIHKEVYGLEIYIFTYICINTDVSYLTIDFI